MKEQNSSGEKPLLVTVVEAAKMLCVSRRTLEREIVAGRFAKPVKIGRASRVPLVEIEAYVRRLAASE